ncbi:hypothetical protein [Psychromonas sp. KJ10-2]|uniref:hypothetical protein n=1 Tax=Psychromonas sp. KJ10-2 TaxID=3391822 RepID=UPI0039B594A1
MMKHSIVGLTGLLAVATTTSMHADNVEIALKHNLDGYLNGYCLDISGGGKNIDPANGLQVHTCYSYKGALGSDLLLRSLVKISYICQSLTFALK